MPCAGRGTLRPASPADATVRGIAFIHQELNLFTNLSIAENIFIDGFPRRFGLIDRGGSRRPRARFSTASTSSTLPIPSSGNSPPASDSWSRSPRRCTARRDLIIFDEPTTSLTPRETERLFEVIERLGAEGRTVIYISHILGDVMRLSDRIAVLRDGRLVDEGAAGDFTSPG